MFQVSPVLFNHNAVQESVKGDYHCNQLNHVEKDGTATDVVFNILVVFVVGLPVISERYKVNNEACYNLKNDESDKSFNPFSFECAVFVSLDLEVPQMTNICLVRHHQLVQVPFKRLNCHCETPYDRNNSFD